MAFLGRAAWRLAAAAAGAAARARPPSSASARTVSRSYSSEHTKEKNVPYEKTLKQDGGSSGPSKPLPR